VQPAPEAVQQSKEEHVHSELLEDFHGESNVAYAPECAEEQWEPYDRDYAEEYATQFDEERCFGVGWGGAWFVVF
jgi:hypothetical protein